MNYFPLSNFHVQGITLDVLTRINSKLHTKVKTFSGIEVFINHNSALPLFIIRPPLNFQYIYDIYPDLDHIFQTIKMNVSKLLIYNNCVAKIKTNKQIQHDFVVILIIFRIKFDPLTRATKMQNSLQGLL